METLHRKFIELGLPHNYTILQVEEMLVNEYAAKEIPKSTVADLINDPQVDFHSIAKCFDIDGENILNNKFSDTEKAIHQQYAKDHSNHPSVHTATDWAKMQAGKLLRVVLISNDNQTLSSFTIQGLCNNLVTDLTVMQGIPPENCTLNNEYYKKYLQLLQRKGLL